MTIYFLFIISFYVLYVSCLSKASLRYSAIPGGSTPWAGTAECATIESPMNTVLLREKEPFLAPPPTSNHLRLAKDSTVMLY
jgi:hypothetical protein